jgi:hypothetical protein
MTDTIETIERALATLATRRSKLEQRLAQTEKRRQVLAYDGPALGDHEAAFRLKELTTDIAELVREIEHINAAEAEGQRRLAAAHKGNARVAANEHAQRAHALLDEIMEPWCEKFGQVNPPAELRLGLPTGKRVITRRPCSPSQRRLTSFSAAVASQCSMSETSSLVKERLE